MSNPLNEAADRQKLLEATRGQVAATLVAAMIQSSGAQYSEAAVIQAYRSMLSKLWITP